MSLSIFETHKILNISQKIDMCLLVAVCFVYRRKKLLEKGGTVCILVAVCLLAFFEIHKMFIFLKKLLCAF